MNSSLTLKSGLVMLALVTFLAITLALLLPKSFFQDWGWLSGPAALAICAWGTARILALPTVRTLLGLVFAAIPGLFGVLIGVHWLGTLLAVVTFAAWCGLGPESRRA